jgi:uncharacterized membrane protein
MDLSPEQRVERLQEHLADMKRSGAHIEEVGRSFAIVLLTAPLQILRLVRMVVLLAVGVAAWTLIGGAIFLIAAAVAGAGIVQQMRLAGQATRRVIVRVGDRGDLIVRDLPA